MAFAAARMIKDKKDLDSKKKSFEGIQAHVSRARSKLNVRGSQCSSTASSFAGFSHLTEAGKAKAKGRGHGHGKKHPGRGTVKCVKKIKGKKGGPDSYELIVTLDQDGLALNDEQVAEYKEVFMLFDKDEDGVLSFAELNVVMKSLGQRPSESKLLSMVRSVSEDTLHDTIEFNEFLQMMSHQQSEKITVDSLIDAFRIFDKDDDGKLSVPELKKIMSTLGERMAKRELEEMVTEADSRNEGVINYEDFCKMLCEERKIKSSLKKTADSRRKLDHNRNLS